MVLETALGKLQTFRQSIYLTVFGGVAVLMDLPAAIGSNTTASSVAQLSLTPQFRREYGILYRGISDFVDGFSLHPLRCQAAWCVAWCCGGGTNAGVRLGSAATEMFMFMASEDCKCGPRPFAG